jgi:hypothetical protein
MATATRSLKDWGIDERAHPVLARCFTAEEQQRMIEDDLYAGRSVSLELVAVVAVGLFIGALAVLLTL